MPITIRPATETDLPDLARMNRSLIEDERSRNPMDIAQLQERMRGFLNSGWHIHLFFAGEVTAGYSLFQVRQDEYFPDLSYVYLRQFYIERPLRRLGLGRQAFDLLARTCFPPGCRVVLDVLEANPAGRRFWEVLGFQPHCHTMHLERSES